MEKCAAAGNMEMFPRVVKRNYQDILPSILNHLDTLSQQIFSIQYDWVRNPFVEFDPSKGQFTLAEKEELASVSRHFGY